MAFSIRKAFNSCRLRREFVEDFFQEPDMRPKFPACVVRINLPGGRAFRFPLRIPARMIRGYFERCVIFGQVGVDL
ncbi:hypothetical protein [Pseudomonas fluorescens]|uniref:hypothetical protein n=1 Tax=Pseudomonas fluorescens TaxID=294 RepID=UPI0012D7545B|nr:hypothetical protein [Pseudomonas fluorescens]